MQYLPHQTKAGNELLAVLKAHKVALLFGEMRSGKTATAIYVAETLPVKNILIVTKKNAIPGWESELKRTQATKHYTVINYEAAKKHKPVYDFAIVDESHNLGRPGRPTERFKAVRTLTHNIPLLLSTGTPMVETQLSAFYQFGLTKYTPLKFKNFYAFFHQYGVPETLYVSGRTIQQYKTAKPELINVIQPYIVSMSQQQAGITHRATDKLERVNLDTNTKMLIKQIVDDEVAIICGEEVAFESDMGIRSAIHQIESGAIKINGKIIELENNEVVDYIWEHFGDSPEIGLMAHYHSTVEKLKRHLPNCKIYSSNSHCEGVDLSHLKHFIIVNADYSGAKALQRRERITHMNRKTDAVVHHIVSADGISLDVYNATSRKRDFNLAVFRRICSARKSSAKGYSE